MINLPVEAMTSLCEAALVANRCSEAVAREVAAALLAAEADGLKGHGVSRVPSYAGQSLSGKVNGFADPVVSRAGTAALRVDACDGFAYPAMTLAIDSLAELAPTTGIAAAAITNSHHCGAASYHVERLAAHGLLALLVANSPKAIAPWGGDTPLFGTNPIAFAAPREGAPPLLIDLSLSKVARGKILVASQRKEPIPEGWALDANGNPTTDADAALEGTMLPMGDAKGAALVMMVEVMAAALTGASFGFEASSFFSADGESPRVGQFLIAISPSGLSAGRFGERLECMITAIEAQDGTRLPGVRRYVNRKATHGNGVELPEELHDQIVRLGADGGH